MTRKPYMNPYLAGVILGLVLLSAMVFSGRGLGASGGIKYFAVSIAGAVDQEHVSESSYYSKYSKGGKNPLKNWLTLEILGMIIGGFILRSPITKSGNFVISNSPTHYNSTSVSVDYYTI